MAYKQISPQVVAEGGTGATTLTDNGVLVGSGVGAITALAVGSTGELLVGTSAADPAFGTSANGNFTFTNASAGITRTLTISNTDATGAAVSSSALDLITQSGSDGDPFIHLNVNGGQDYALGIDNTDADALKIQDDANPSTGNTLWKMTSAGERTMPLQPSFLAYQGTTDNNVTGDGTTFTLGDTDVGTTLTEIIDQNGDFTPGASGGAVFTAPVTGQYLLQMTVRFSGGSGTRSGGSARLVTSNRTYRETFLSDDSAFRSIIFVIADMDVGDTAQYEVSATYTGGKTIDVIGGSPLETYVSGTLIC